VVVCRTVQLRGIREIDIGRCPSYLGQKDIKHVLLSCSGARNLKKKLNKKYLKTKEEVAYKKL
jgi:hypothetical protein